MIHVGLESKHEISSITGWVLANFRAHKACSGLLLFPLPLTHSLTITQPKANSVFILPWIKVQKEMKEKDIPGCIHFHESLSSLHDN